MSEEMAEAPDLEPVCRSYAAMMTVEVPPVQEQVGISVCLEMLFRTAKLEFGMLAHRA